MFRCPDNDVRFRRWRWLAAAVLAVSLSLPVVGAEPGPEAVYAAALIRERVLRAPGGDPPLQELRAAIAGYEDIVRRFPQSAFDDHSLWQGAGLALQAYERYRQPEDLDTGTRLLRLLAFNHPTSSFAARVPERLERLNELRRVARVTRIDRERLPDVVRVTMTLDREVTFVSEHLSGPDRLFFDLRGTQASPELRDATLVFTDDEDAVRQVRLGRHPHRVTRVVLDTEDTDGCHSFTLYDPFRIVVDCRPAFAPVPGIMAARPTSREFREPRLLTTLPAMGTAVAPVPPPRGLSTRALPVMSVPVWAPRSLVPVIEDVPISVRRLDPIPPSVSPPTVNSDGVYSVARQLGLRLSRIVLDPGHGGQDPGAIGSGVNEAALVLDLALRLERRLESSQPGLEVVLTRRDDEYVPLEARTALANRVGADLFLSIHANASENGAARGVETYYLDFAADSESEALAARENVGGLSTMAELEGLLQAIAANSKLDESRDFAQSIQQSLLRTLRPVNPELPDLGVKQAPFVVLIGARMPSVLSEISFLTNETDASLLTSDRYRDRIVDALFEGILQYQLSLGTAPVVALANAELSDPGVSRLRAGSDRGGRGGSRRGRR